MHETTQVITHSGQFHADEVTAIAIYCIKYNRNPDTLNITRTRDFENLSGIFIDVGGKYNPETNHFDHHHFDSDLSSAGMMWKEMLSDFTFNPRSVNALIKQVDDQDLGRTKQEPFHYCNIISLLNTEDGTPEEQDEAFSVAVWISMTILANLLVKDEIESCKADLASNIPIITNNDVRIAFIPKDGPYLSSNLFVGKADVLVSYDSTQNCWTLLMVTLEHGSFESKYKIDSVTNPIFVHVAKFIAKFNTAPENPNTITFSLTSESDTITINLDV